MLASSWAVLGMTFEKRQAAVGLRFDLRKSPFKSENSNFKFN